MKEYRAIGLMTKSFAGEVDFKDNGSGVPLQVQALDALNKHFNDISPETNEDDRDLSLENLMVKGGE